MSKKYINLADIDHNLGNDGNMAGIVPSLIYGYWEDVAAWPDEPTGETTALELAAAGTLTGDVVMKSATKAYKLDFTEDVGNFKMAVAGELDGKYWNYELAIIKAKIQKTILGFANAAVSRKMFFIVQDENGTYYLMGNKRRGASLSGGDGATTGTGGNDRNQIGLNFEFRTRKAFTYEGDVTTLLTTTP